jgi:hypothetical protein
MVAPKKIHQLLKELSLKVKVFSVVWLFKGHYLFTALFTVCGR